MRSPLLLAAATIVAASLPLASCGPPVMNTPVNDIPKLATLAEVMDNQATTADPQFKKIGDATFTDADFQAFAAAAVRLKATSEKTKAFSKGPEFDALATRLGEKATSLGAAADRKDAAGSSAALAEMKATCKECHSTFR